MKIVLASASPRRKELIGTIFDEFEQVIPDIDETVPERIEPEEGPEYLAVRKALKVAEVRKDELVIACDTSVFLDGHVLGKPGDAGDAERMLRLLSGRTHKVITGCCVWYKRKQVSFSETTLVRFYTLSDNDISEYISTGEPFDKAGAYGAQGKGMLLVHSVEGDFFNVIGLPVAKLKRVIDTFLKIQEAQSN